MLSVRRGWCVLVAVMVVIAVCHHVVHGVKYGGPGPLEDRIGWSASSTRILVLNPDDGDVFRGAFRHVLANDASRSGFNGLLDELVAVHHGARDGHKQSEGLDFSGVHCNVFNSDMRRASHLEDACVVEQI